MGYFPDTFGADCLRLSELEMAGDTINIAS